MSENPTQKLGWFLGVFTPTILTILGVIMFLRLGWVVAQAGLVGALLIVLIANTITGITALSMSTLATNTRVGVGGAYFLISRSFGLEVGGAIGIPLYLSQVLSLSMYAFGLGESVRILWPSAPDLWIRILAALIVLGVTFVAAKSTRITLLLQIPVMVLIGISVVALVAGVEFNTVKVAQLGPWEQAGFWEVFAVFFPAVTGILTGLSLSGDLEDPGRSIPLGGLLATAVGAVIYVVLTVSLAYAGPAATIADPMAWTQIAWMGKLTVLGGMWGAIASSAFGSILSAPRTLQALAIDRLVPVKLGEIDETTGEPLVGIRVSGAIAFLAVVLLGALDNVALVVTMFFLTTYGALNLVAALEGLIGDTSFRPAFRVHWGLSLVGALGCLVAMLAISPWAGFVAIAIEAVVLFALSRRSLQTTFGDARSGLLLTGARYALLRLRDARIDPRNWRPNILVFTTDLHRTLPVVRWAARFGQHRGIVTLEHLVATKDIEGDLADVESLLRTDNATLEREGIEAFCEVTVVEDLDAGALTVAQANGMAGLHSNTVMFGFHQEHDAAPHLARLLRLGRTLSQLEKCVILHSPALPEHVYKPEKRVAPRILVWWAGRENNGDLMLLFAHLVTLASEMRGARIELKTIVEDGPSAEEMRRDMAGMLPSIRIDVEVDVIVRGHGETWHEVIQRVSAGARLVFLGLRFPEPGEEGAYAERLDTLLRQLPDTCLVHNAGPFRGRLV